MAYIYINNQTELEEAFTTLGFVEGTDEDVGKWYYSNDTSRMGYFELAYNTGNASTSPIIYHDSSGQVRNLYGQHNSGLPIIKLEYYLLYNGGICFRWVGGNSSTVVSVPFVNVMTVAIFSVNDGNGYNTIFNTGNSATALNMFLDDMHGIVNAFPHFNFVNNINSTNIIILSKAYDNKGGCIDGEAYIVTSPIPINSADQYFATINGIEYIITFGVSNAPNGRYAFRLADPE